MARQKYTITFPEAMEKALEEEKKRRKLGKIQDAVRSILAEYFAGPE